LLNNDEPDGRWAALTGTSARTSALRIAAAACDQQEKRRKGGAIAAAG